jgi:O-antigen/teichoic acid export membrane protein
MNGMYSAFRELLRSIYQKGFFHLFVSNVLIQIFAFASQLFVAGILQPDDIARIKIIQTYLSVFSIVGAMGFANSTLKHCSENRSDDQKFTLFYHALLFSVFSSAALYGIILLANKLELFSKDVLLCALLPLGLLPIITNTLFVVFVSFYQAQKKMKTIALLTGINKTLSIAGIVVFSCFWGIYGYYAAYNLGILIMLVACFIIIIRTGKKVPSCFALQQLRSSLSLHWYCAKYSMLANFLADTSMYVDIILISLFAVNLHEAGYYSFALTMTVVLRLFPSTVQQIAIPYFSSAYHKPVIMENFRKYNRLLVVVIAVTFVIVIVLVPLFFHVFFAGKYNPSVKYFIPLAIGWSIAQLRQLQSGAIFGLGKIKYITYNNLISLIVNILVFYLAFSNWGLTGMAYASIFTSSLSWLINSFYLRKTFAGIPEVD